MPKINTSRAAARNAKNKGTIPAEAEPEPGSNRDLEKIVEKLIALDKRDTATTIEKGKLLDEALKQCEHGEYMDMIEQKLGWSYTTASRYLEVYRFSQNHQIGDFASLSISALYLVADLVDDDEEELAAINAIIEAAKKGRVTHKMADAIISAHKTLSCHECNERVTHNKMHELGSKLICDDCYQSREADRKEAEALEAEPEPAIEPEETSPPPDGPEPMSVAAGDPRDQEAIPPDSQDQEAVPPEPIKPSSAEANGETPPPSATPTELVRALKVVLHNSERNDVWPKVINTIRAERLLKVITRLQAVYDKHCQGSEVKAKADRAEAKASSQNGRQHR